MKTMIERVRECVSAYPMDFDSVEKLIAFAYMMGREEATKEVSNLYNNHIREQHERAAAFRYHRAALAIVGEETYIHTPDYAQETLALWGGDATNI